MSMKTLCAWCYPDVVEYLACHPKARSPVSHGICQEHARSVIVGVHWFCPTANTKIVRYERGVYVFVYGTNDTRRLCFRGDAADIVWSLGRMIRDLDRRQSAPPPAP